MLTELRTFICVVELNNFTRAAEKLALSQPSVSMHIKNLEDEFGTTLIQRGLKKKNIHIPNGNPENIELECRRYDILIEEKNGIDLQILGISIILILILTNQI